MRDKRCTSSPTARKAGSERPHIASTEIDCRRGGLDYPSCLIIDEYNYVQADDG